jgi:omega-amidase
MKVTIIQTSLAWEAPEQNLRHFEGILESLNNKSDLIVLPEMFSTGFTMNPEKHAEPGGGPAFRWMQRMAAEKQAVLTGSIAVSDNHKYYNRLFWVNPDGSFRSYDKRHLFRMAKEDTHYTAGRDRLITELGAWKICPLVCYDLRFPVWSRNVFKPIAKKPGSAADDKEKASHNRKGEIQKGASTLKAHDTGNHTRPHEGKWEYDVLIYVANWPEARVYHWKQLLIARAIENQCYVIGVNRIGKDGNGFAHSGASLVINPKGEIISNTRENDESMETVTLDKEYLDEYRKTFPAGMDADIFRIVS